jgi:hypothetical protein
MVPLPEEPAGGVLHFGRHRMARYTTVLGAKVEYAVAERVRAVAEAKGESASSVIRRAILNGLRFE